MDKKLHNLFTLGLGAAMLSTSVSAIADDKFDDLNQYDMVEAMGAGWNLGNTLEANSNGTPNETCWGNPQASPALMKLIKSSGFNTIRIPVSYLSKIGSAPNYKIDAAWLARVKEVIDMALAEDLYVITNIHGDGYHGVTGGWLLCDAQNQSEIKAKYKAFWQQIATEFKDYDEHLIFESMNEVFDGTYEWQSNGGTYPNPSYYNNINEYNQIFVETVRPTSINNAKRWLLIPGWNTDIDLTSEARGFKIPEDKYLDRSVTGKRLMISVHYYAPWDLCGDDTDAGVTRWGDAAWSENSSKCTTYGQGPNSESTMSGQFDKLKTWFTSQGYPVIVGEYGTVDKTAFDAENSKYTEYWTKTLCENARRVGAVPVLWDNGHLSTAKGFATINRAQNSVGRAYIVNGINEAFDQDIEIDTTAPKVKLDLITSYVVNLTIDGAKENPVFKCQYAGWDEVSKEVSGTAKNLDVDLSPASKKEGFTNLGYLQYSKDSLYSFDVNKVTINGYEFTNPIVKKTMKAALYQNSLPNIWSGNDGEYVSDNGKAILSITPNAISLMLKLDGPATCVENADAVAANIVSVDGGIVVLGAEGETVDVYTVLGTCVAKKEATDFMTEVKLHEGSYIVKVGTKAYKAIVR
ncbi:MAG: glycoside hydrolase family 5 protein [Bacteroidales bacterium]|nr:glycoside hydrolase family 5 protein [Candidatus Scybalocola fimicaballi]